MGPKNEANFGSKPLRSSRSQAAFTAERTSGDTGPARSSSPCFVNQLSSTITRRVRVLPLEIQALPWYSITSETRP